MITYTKEILHHCYCTNCNSNFTLMDNPDIVTCPHCAKEDELIEKDCYTCISNEREDAFYKCGTCDEFYSEWEPNNGDV